MVSFRFYLVTIVALFLSLAVGVVMGSSLDENIVGTLRDRVQEVRNDLDDTEQVIDDLREEQDRLDEYLEESAVHAVSGRLSGERVVVIAERGVDDDAVQQTVELLQQSGAQAPGILWIEPRWSLEEPGDRADLDEAIGVGIGTTTDMRQAAWAEVVRRLEAAETRRGPDDPLAALGAAGFLGFDEIGSQGDIASLPGPGVRAVLVSGSGTDLPPEVLPDLASGLVDVGVPTVAGEVWREQDGGPDRGTVLENLRTVGALDDAVATVDDLDLVQGRVAAVLALDDLGAGIVGHYGYGPDADSVLPDPANV